MISEYKMATFNREEKKKKKKKKKEEVMVVPCDFFEYLEKTKLKSTWGCLSSSLLLERHVIKTLSVVGCS